jgi:hypothetical protein
MIKKIFLKLFNILLTILILIYLILEELIWERIAEPLYAYFHELKLLQKFESVIKRQNRYTVLALFLVMFVVVEALGLGAFALFAAGQVIPATLVYTGKIPVTALTFWLFKAAETQLLSFAWFNVCYQTLLSLLNKIKTSAVYINVKAKIAAIKTRIKTVVAEPFKKVKAFFGWQIKS